MIRDLFIDKLVLPDIVHDVAANVAPIDNLIAKLDEDFLKKVCGAWSCRVIH